MKTAIVLHHTADSSNGDQYQKTYDYHNAGAPMINGVLKWPKGHGIQYAFFIERTGYIVKGRKEHETTWHAGRVNEISIAICLAGDFRFQSPTEEQTNSMVQIINELKSRHPIQHIYNHYQVRPTSCPVIDLVGLYEQEMVIRGLDSSSAIALRIRAIKRGMERSVAPVKDMLQKQLSRLLNRLDHPDHRL